MPRTTHRTSKGTKLYVVRDKSGKFKDIQTYKRAHSAELAARRQPLRCNDTRLLYWIINNLLNENQLDVIPPGHTRALRFWGHA